MRRKKSIASAISENRKVSGQKVAASSTEKKIKTGQVASLTAISRFLASERQHQGATYRRISNKRKRSAPNSVRAAEGIK